MNGNRPRLGAILVEQGVIATEELQAAVLYQLRAESVEGRTLLAEINAHCSGRRPCRHMRLGEVLVAVHLCSEQEIAQALAVQLRLPFADLQVLQPTEEALRALPAAVALEKSALPLLLQNGALVVAVADPGTPQLRDTLTTAAGMPVAMHCAAESEVRARVQRIYAPVPEEPLTASPTRGSVAMQDRRWTESSARAMVEAHYGGGTSIDVFNRLLSEAIRANATDLYLEPTEEHLRAQIRLAGRLETIAHFSPNQLFGIATHVKMMAGMECCDPPVAQDGSCPVREGGRRLRLNVSVLPGVFGESVIVRIAGA